MAITMNTQFLNDKTVVITGAGTELCHETARRFGAAGAFVVIAGNDRDDGVAAETQLRAAGIQTAFEALDARDPASCSALAGKVAHERGGINVWVNIPAMISTAPAESMQRVLWDDAMAAVLSGTFYCAQAAGRHMLAQPGGGVIINVSSVAGMVHEKGYAASCVANAGIIALTEALGVEWAGRGVRVVGVAPAPAPQPTQSDEGLEQFKRRSPMKRPATWQEIAEAVFYLAGAEASYITAETLRVDGGWVAYQLF
jgi:NAD(P)-dependent dehydrogenase (short-subunit alcohol dehydrogenase family)